MFFLGTPAMLSPKSRYSRLNQNPASPSTDHDSNSSELHQVIRKEGGNDESYGRAHPPFCTYHFLMPVCAALAIAIALTAGGIWFQFGRESIVSPSNIHVEAEGSEFYLSMSLPGRDQALSLPPILPPPVEDSIEINSDGTQSSRGSYQEKSLYQWQFHRKSLVPGN